MDVFEDPWHTQITALMTQTSLNLNSLTRKNHRKVDEYSLPLSYQQDDVCKPTPTMPIDMKLYPYRDMTTSSTTVPPSHVNNSTKQKLFKSNGFNSVIVSKP